MATCRGMLSLSKVSCVLRSRLIQPSLRRLKSTSAEEEYSKVKKGTWGTVIKILCVPAFGAYAYKYHIGPALDEGVPEGVHVFTWLIARCMMTDIKEEERMMEEHLMRMREYADDYLIAKEANIYKNYPFVIGKIEDQRPENERTIFNEVGPDGY